MARDSFAPQVRTPAAVGQVEIILTVAAGDPATYAGRYTFDVLDADGATVDVRQGDLVPHLTGGQITNIKAFLDAMLTKAQGVVG